MAAITKRLLQLRPTFHAHARPYASTHHHFSSSSDRDDKPQSEQPDKDKVSSMLSSFNDNFSSSSDRDDKPQSEQPGVKVSSILSSLSDVRASLQKQPPPPDRRQPLRSPFSQTPRPPGSGSPSGEIYSRLAEFRSRSAPPPPPNPQHSSGQYASFQELFEKRVPPKGEGSAAPSGPDGGGSSSFDPIRQSLNRLQSSGSVDPGRNPPESWSLSRFTGSMKSKANPNANLVRGSGNLTSPFLSKDAKGKGFGGMGLRNMDDRKSLGDKLKTLRPVKRKGNWFSLQELNDRLAKVKETEDSELEKSGLPVEAIKQSLFYIKKNSEQPKNKGMPISILGSMGVALDENTGPPKDHLVERYFHPDNMSSAEKLKLELQKVRDEFKMSESDCGSARVQVAQLTTKIKHLSTALHKKDKHSRKGLHEMVQRRKKLLKYLRRTDWDSYCLVLSKLGLRDNPDIKA